MLDVDARCGRNGRELGEPSVSLESDGAVSITEVRATAEHWTHVPQEMPAPDVMRSPSLNPVTAAPSDQPVPANSCPGTIGPTCPVTSCRCSIGNMRRARGRIRSRRCRRFRHR